MHPSSEFAGFARALVPAVLEASRLAHSMEGRVRNVPKSEEAGDVKQALTAADTAAQEAILRALLELYPQVSLAAEEDTPTVARFPASAPALVVIDPIDGTLHSYLEERGPYAVIVGLAIDRRVQASIVALPREGQTFVAEIGRGAERIAPDATSKPVSALADGDRVLVSHEMPRRVVSALRAEGLQPVPACGGAIAIAPLIRGVRAGLRYAPGSLPGGISIRGRVGTLIAREAGAHVRGDAGLAFPTDLDTPTRSLLVAADPADVPLLEKCLAQAERT